MATEDYRRRTRARSRALLPPESRCAFAYLFTSLCHLDRTRPRETEMGRYRPKSASEFVQPCPTNAPFRYFRLGLKRKPTNARRDGSVESTRRWFCKRCLASPMWSLRLGARTESFLSGIGARTEGRRPEAQGQKEDGLTCRSGPRGRSLGAPLSDAVAWVVRPTWRAIPGQPYAIFSGSAQQALPARVRDRQVSMRLCEASCRHTRSEFPRLTLFCTARECAVPARIPACAAKTAFSRSI